MKVIEVDTIFKTMHFDNKKTQRAVTSLKVIDGDMNCILVKLASQLSNASGLIQSRSILQFL